MTLHAMKQVLDADPFRPFTLRLADGRALRVLNPHNVAFLGNGRTLFVAHHKSEQFELIDLLLVNSIVVGNSQTPRRRKSA